MTIRINTVLTRQIIAFGILVVLASQFNARASGPLWEAITYNNAERAKALVNLGADVNQKNGYGNPIIHHAVGEGNAEIVELLIKKGADVNTKGQFDRVALHYANKKGIAKILLANGATVDAPTNYGETPLHWAASAVNSLDIQGRVDLVEFAETLVLHGADVNKKTGAGRSYRTPLNYAVSSNNLAVAKILIAHGADVAGDTSSPLSSIGSDNVEIAQLLIGHGANVNAATLSGQYPLWAAAAKGQVKVTGYLLEKGADPNATNGAGLTALYMAAGSDYNVSTITTLLKSGAKPNVQSTSGFAAPHQAAQQNAIKVIELLLANGADVNIATNSGETPLHRVLMYGKNETMKDVVEILLKNGANTNAERSSDERTPFHEAIARGDIELVKLLMNYGVDLNFVSKVQGTYLNFARNSKVISELLRESGAK